MALAMRNINPLKGTPYLQQFGSKGAYKGGIGGSGAMGLPENGMGAGGNMAMGMDLLRMLAGSETGAGGAATALPGVGFDAGGSLLGGLTGGGGSAAPLGFDAGGSLLGGIAGGGGSAAAPVGFDAAGTALGGLTTSGGIGGSAAAGGLGMAFPIAGAALLGAAGLSKIADNKGYDFEDIKHGWTEPIYGSWHDLKGGNIRDLLKRTGGAQGFLASITDEDDDKYDTIKATFGPVGGLFNWGFKGGNTLDLINAISGSLDQDW